MVFLLKQFLKTKTKLETYAAIIASQSTKLNIYMLCSASLTVYKLIIIIVLLLL